MLLLPLPASPAYNVITTIEGVDYELVYTYDEHRDLWRFGVDSLSGDAVMGHRPLLPFVQMRPNAFASALDGVFALIAPLPTDDAYEALVGGLWSVVYGDPSEIAELADSLADLAGDAEIPVVPIEVIYPPNNAVLSNPVVTFSGTGPANQLLFVRGESIQVDSMGSWVWTHTFSEASPNVVFEGESGQRATVRFSIIMQPLLINPVGEDIDGTRYAFTEDVEVTGTATPNSAITVNGQTVSVGSDGTWSVVLTLSAGQSHTVTAQSADGQVAQTSVYVWGEPDLMALDPLIWLDPTDASTLFVDSAGTIPCVPDDPVGLWVNKGTIGAVGNAAQPVSASRPVWTDTGGGGVVSFDGVSSAINIAHRFQQWGFTVASTIAVVSGGYFIGNGANEEGHWAISRQPSWGVGNRTAIVGVLTSTGWQIQSNVDDSTQNDPISSIGVFSVNDSSIRTRGGKTVSSNPITAPEPLAARDLIRIGAIRATSLHANMEAGHIFLFDRELTDEEQMKLLAWMEAQHGV